MSEELDVQNRGGPTVPFFNRPWVLLTLLGLVVGVLLWVFLGPRRPDGDAEEGPSPDQAALRRAAASAKLMQFTSEAQRLYRRGLGQCREGDVIGARQTWADVAALFADAEEEAPWVRLAESGLELLKDVERPPEARHEAVQKTLQKIDKLREEGRAAEAEALRQALLGLYGNDPAARELLRK